MNLAGIVQRALRAVPNGVRGRVTITRTLRGVLNPAIDARLDSTSAFDASCVVVPPKTEYVDGIARIPVYEREMLLAANDCAWRIEVGMRATLNGIAYRIVAVTELNPSGTEPVLYTLGLAR